MSRVREKCVILGESKDLSIYVLPTIADILKYYKYIISERKFQGQNRNDLNPTFIIAKKVANIWERASIPTVSLKRTADIIGKLHKERQMLAKSFKRDEMKPSYQIKLESFRERSKMLLDVASCKCQAGRCCCEKEFRVPIDERAFLLDQRTVRKQMIAGVDRKYAAKRNARQSRQCTNGAEAENDPNESENVVSTDGYNEIDTPSSSSAMVNEGPNDAENEPNEIENVESTDGYNAIDTPSSSSPTVNEGRNDSALRNYNSINVKTLAKVLDRYKVSNRAGAAIASAALIDAGLATKDNPTNLIDKCKLQRARKRERETRSTNLLNEVCSIYFDGRKDKTLKFTDGKLHYAVEEHVVIITEPGTQYFGHVSPISSAAANIISSIIDLFNSRTIPMSEIRAVGCDGTVVNTGNRGGVIALLEAKISSPVQWFICQLHANELPLRHLMLYLDGTTQGPKAFSGPIGKQLPYVEKLPAVAFEAIDTELPIILRTDLSSDQSYLYEMVQSISDGRCSEALLKREPGPMAHSRWLTTANRILRLYVATHQPHPNLITLTTFVMKVYAPMWFEIKRFPSCFFGARHLHKTIRISRYLPHNLKAVIDPVIQRNGYFGHPENILLAMLADDKLHIRKLALRRICKLREKPITYRKFVLPPFKMNSCTYWDMVDWHNDITPYSEPPILMKYSKEDLQEMELEPKNCTVFMEVGNLPCHTQAVERAVKLMTETATKVCGQQSRDGVIRNTLLSRQAMPKCDSKKDLLRLH